MASDTGEQHSRPHTRAQRALFVDPSACRLLSGSAAYVRSDHCTAFGHAQTAEAFVFEDGYAVVSNLLVAAEGNSVQSMLLHIGSFCDTQFCPDRHIFAKVSVTFAIDSPTLSCLP